MACEPERETVWGQLPLVYNLKFVQPQKSVKEEKHGMAGLFENKQVLTRIFIGIFVGLIAVSMLLYLVPQGPGAGATTTDTVATVGGRGITVQDIQQRMQQISAGAAKFQRLWSRSTPARFWIAWSSRRN